MNAKQRSFVTVRNEVAKVMFLQVSVCPQGRCLVRGCMVPGSGARSQGLSDPGGVHGPGEIPGPGGECLVPGERGWYPSMH